VVGEHTSVSSGKSTKKSESSATSSSESSGASSSVSASSRGIGNATLALAVDLNQQKCNEIGWVGMNETTHFCFVSDGVKLASITGIAASDAISFIEKFRVKK